MPQGWPNRSCLGCPDAVSTSSAILAEKGADHRASVNFAFASIAPGSYKVVPMDSQTPESLFKEVPNLKQIKPDLKVFVSIGGW